MDEFVSLCHEAGIETLKTLTQIKEKWRSVFDKYKAVNDNNNRTGRDRKTFEFYDDIDEFMSTSDKVNPRFIKETKLSCKDTESDNEDQDSSGNADAATVSNRKADAEVVGDEDSASNKRRNKKSPDGQEKKKKKKSALDTSDTEDAILKMLDAQQEAMEKAQQNDERMLQALLKSQENAQQRHQEFTVAVLGKLGELFAPKK